MHQFIKLYMSWVEGCWEGPMSIPQSQVRKEQRRRRVIKVIQPATFHKGRGEGLVRSIWLSTFRVQELLSLHILRTGLNDLNIPGLLCLKQKLIVDGCLSDL